MTKNMADFNRCAAMVLSALHESFPLKVTIDIRELDDDADKAAIENFRASVHFLEAEGVIRYGTAMMSGCFSGAQLTAKGLSVLNSMPEALQERADYAGTLKKVLTEGSKAALKTVVDSIIEKAMKG